MIFCTSRPKELVYRLCCDEDSAKVLYISSGVRCTFGSVHDDDQAMPIKR